MNLIKSIRESFFIFFFFSLIMGISSTSIIHASELDFTQNLNKLKIELSARHLSYSRQTLVELMGTEDNLVKALLILRRESKPATLGIRAEKLLISFNSREDVRSALLADVEDENYFGLGSVVISSLDQIEDQNFRKFLAKSSLSTSNKKANQSSRYRAIIEAQDPNLLK